MKKKLLIMAMLVVASSLSYAKVGETNFGENYKIKFNNGFDGNKVDGNKIRWAGVDTLNKVQGEFKDVQAQLDGKVDKDKFESAYNELHMSQSFTDEAIKTHRQEIDALDKNVTELEGKLDKKADVDFVNEQTDKVFNDLNAQKVDKSEFNDLQAHVDAVEADKDALRAEMNANKQELNDKIDVNTDKLQQQIDKNNHVSVETDKQLNEKIDTNTEALNNKIEANKSEQDATNDKLQQQIDKNNHVSVETDKQLNEKIDTNTEALNNKIDANKNELNNKIDKNNAIIQGEIDRVDGKTDALNNRVDGIVQSNKVENDKQNNRLDKVETENENQNTAIEGLQSQTNHNSENIETNKQNIEANKEAIDKETADRVAADQEIMNNIEKYNGQYEARMNAMDKKIDNLDEKMNKGLSLMAAMNAVDFQDVQEGEMAIGAGVGHYGNAQSVAVGVAYSPSQNLNVNMKYSVTAGDVDSFAVGAGASYKFRVK